MKFLVLFFVFSIFSVPAMSEVFEGSHSYETTEWVSGLNSPWAITQGPGNVFFVTEKNGRLLKVKDGKIIQVIQGIPQSIKYSGQGGLMDVALHPNFEQNNFIYLSYSTSENALPANGINTRISRFELKGDKLENENILVQGAYGTDGAHFGCRLSFSKSGYLFATFGDRHHKEKAQDLAYLNGKVIRLHDDGRIPADNPFVGRAGAREEIFSLGHRNPQGLDIDPRTDFPVVSEHGPSGYDAQLPGVGRVGKADEVNLVLAGHNYGWPILFGSPDVLPWTREMFDFRQLNNVQMPIREFTVPDGVAPSGASFYHGNQFPLWQNNLFVAALRGYVVRLSFTEAGELIEEEKIVPNGLFRVRDVEVGLDGNLYILSDLGTITQVKPGQ